MLSSSPSTLESKGKETDYTVYFHFEFHTVMVVEFSGDCDTELNPNPNMFLWVMR